MMMKLLKCYIPALMGLVFIFFLSGCSKENNPDTDGDITRVQVVLGGIDNKDITALKSSNGSNTGPGKNIQIKDIKLGEGLYLQATLSKADENLPGASPVTLRAGSSPKKAVANDVLPGVKYMVVVFDDHGYYVDQAEYTAGGTNTPQFTLTPNKQYTFICYSLNGPDSLPWLSNTGSSLADANLGLNFQWNSTTANEDLLYTRIDQVMAPGINVLDILFKHKFAEITTKIDATAIGPIAGTDLAFSEVYRVIDVDMENGTMGYKNPTSRPLVFPSLNNTVITSQPMIIARPGFNGPNPYPGSAVIRKLYGNIRIGNDEKYFEVPELAVEPGERYILNIVIKSSPDQLAGLVWAPGNLKYDGASYVFSYTNGPGSYFPFGHLYPYGDPRAYSNDEYNLGDPCTNIYDMYPWRTPTKADFEALAALGTAENRTINGVDGAWYPTSATKGVFFPAVGYKDIENSVSNPLWAAGEGWYWTKTHEGDLIDGSSGGIFGFQIGLPSAGLRPVQVVRRAMNTVPAGTNDYVRSRSAQIRCVRNL